MSDYVGTLRIKGLRHHTIPRILGPKFTNFAELLVVWQMSKNMPKILSSQGQDQPPEMFYKKRYPQNIRKSQRKIPVPESCF